MKLVMRRVPMGWSNPNINLASVLKQCVRIRKRLKRNKKERGVWAAVWARCWFVCRCTCGCGWRVHAVHMRASTSKIPWQIKHLHIKVCVCVVAARIVHTVSMAWRYTRYTRHDARDWVDTWSTHMRGDGCRARLRVCAHAMHIRTSDRHHHTAGRG